MNPAQAHFQFTRNGKAAPHVELISQVRQLQQAAAHVVVAVAVPRTSRNSAETTTATTSREEVKRAKFVAVERVWSVCVRICYLQLQLHLNFIRSCAVASNPLTRSTSPPLSFWLPT